MACSRIPKWKLRPAKFPAEKSPASAALSRVFVDGARSADPPISHGMFLATAFSTFAEDSRVARPFGSAGNSGRSRSQPSGSWRCCIRNSSSASSGYWLAIFGDPAQTKSRADPCLAYQSPDGSDRRRHPARRSSCHRASRSCAWRDGPRPRPTAHRVRRWYPACAARRSRCGCQR